VAVAATKADIDAECRPGGDDNFEVWPKEFWMPTLRAATDSEGMLAREQIEDEEEETENDDWSRETSPIFGEC